jgi:ribosomal protein S18 acetylase RimI-like enzyme
VEEPVLTDPFLIAALESRLVNAWPSFSYELFDGWLLRLAKGYSKRANSGSPLMQGARLDDQLLDHMKAQFIAANVRPTFRLTGLEAPETDAILERAGFIEIEPTIVLTAPVGSECEADEEVVIEPHISKGWAKEAARAYGATRADDATLFEIISRIRQATGFATLSLDQKPVAWGLGVYERGYVGLYDIVVAPDLRGIGLGRRVVSSLMAWGCQQGASHAYLQVLESNEVARALYADIGFTTAYRYRHRVFDKPVR